MKNEVHILLATHLRELGLCFEQEAQINPNRKWRWDFLISEQRPTGMNRCAVGRWVIDIQGATWIQGRHTRGAGYQNDCDKANDAVGRGWNVLRFTSQDVLTGRAKKFLEEHLG